MEVVAHHAPRRARLHHQRLVAPLKNRPVTSLPAKPIVAIGKRGLQPLHSRRQIARRRLHGQMEMIAHDHIRMQHPVRPRAGVKHAGLERVAGPRRAERPDAAIAPIDHMVNRAGKFESQFARHTVDHTPHLP